MQMFAYHAALVKQHALQVLSPRADRKINQEIEEGRSRFGTAFVIQVLCYNHVMNDFDDKLKLDDLGRSGFKLYQDDKGFKLGTASVLLAWFAASFVRRSRQSDTRMLELGSGIGSCAMLTAARLQGVAIDCVELMPKPFGILKKNIEVNNAGIRVRAFNADIRQLPDEVKGISYDVVFMNPPFFSSSRGTKTDTDVKSKEKLMARFNEEGTLEDFIGQAAKRVRPSGGYVVMCMSSDRLPECIELFRQSGITPSRLMNVHSLEDKDSFLFLLAGKKGAPNADFRVLPPLVLNCRTSEGGIIRTEALRKIYEEEHTDCFIS